MHQIHRFDRKGPTEPGQTGYRDESDVSIRALKNTSRSSLTAIYGHLIMYYSGEGCSLCDLYSLLNNEYGSTNQKMSDRVRKRTQWECAGCGQVFERRSDALRHFAMSRDHKEAKI